MSTGVGTTKVFTRGTHRVRTPEDTWAVIEPRLPAFGVSRVADVTGLDTLGIPTAMSVRPMARTLTVSQGKGQTLTAAKVSAAMEAVELWHAEHAVPDLVHTATPARELGLSYPVDRLGVTHGPFLSEASPLDWIEAVGLVSGERIPVPRDAVFFPDAQALRWSPAYIRPNSNGLASGNVRDEAVVHALYEIVERDTLGRRVGRPEDGVHVVPESVPEEVCQHLVRDVRDVGGRVCVASLPNRFDVPTYLARIWTVDFSTTCGGFGSHTDPLVAVSRAVTEAAQSRLTAITGTRDDLTHHYDHLDQPLSRGQELAQFPAPTATFDEATPPGAARYHDDMADERAWLAGMLTEEIGHEPLLVDIGTDPAFAVVKVLLPGAAFEESSVHTNHERRA